VVTKEKKREGERGRWGNSERGKREKRWK